MSGFQTSLMKYLYVLVQTLLQEELIRWWSWLNSSELSDINDELFVPYDYTFEFCFHNMKIDEVTIIKIETTLFWLKNFSFC